MAATLVLFLSLVVAGGVAVYAGGCESVISPKRGAANQLAAAAACTTDASHLSTAGAISASEATTCDAPAVTALLTTFCIVGTDDSAPPTAMCCGAVLLTVEVQGCLCRVSDAAEFDVSDLTVAGMWRLYKTCGGARRTAPRDKNSCEAGSPPPPPPPPTKPEERPAYWPLVLWVAVGLLCGAAVVTASISALRLWLALVPRVQAPPVSQHHSDEEQDIEDGVPQVNSPSGIIPAEVLKPRADEDPAKAIAKRKRASPTPSPPHVEGMTRPARAHLPPRPLFAFAPQPLPVVPQQQISISVV